MDWNEILMTYVIPALATALMTGLGIVCTAVYKAIQEYVKDKKVQKYLIIATDCVSDAVLDIAQTFIDKIKEEEWNEDTKQEAFNKAKEKALKHLGITGKALLEEALGDFDGWINSKIEAEVKRLAVS
jgi:hypothetical protein